MAETEFKNIDFDHVEIIVSILGIIESQGAYLSSAIDKITNEDIPEILDMLYKDEIQLELLKKYDLKIILTNNESEKLNYIKKFRDEFSSKKTKNGVLIIKLLDSWSIYGYDDYNTFKEIILKPNDELANELDKPEKIRDKMKILEESTVKLSHTSFKGNYKRQLDNAREIFNRLKEGNFYLKANRFIHKKLDKEIPEDLKKDKAYQMILIIHIAFLLYRGTLNIDFLHQIIVQEFPIQFFTTLAYAIQKKIIIRFNYINDREKKEYLIEDVIPVKIDFKDRYWSLICWKISKEKWVQFYLHSIRNIELTKNSHREFTTGKTPEFHIEEFNRQFFSHYGSSEMKKIDIVIRVPEYRYETIKRRRSEGIWEKKDGYYLWTVSDYFPEKILDYVFSWGGILTIVSPEFIIQEFKEKLERVLKQYT